MHEQSTTDPALANSTSKASAPGEKGVENREVVDMAQPEPTAVAVASSPFDDVLAAVLAA